MADQIKEMQRTDPTAKEQWYAYCEAYGDNVRDPSRHDLTFINSFITQYASGARLEYKEGSMLVKMIKLGQRKSPSWKAVWEMYCNSMPVDGNSEFGKPAYDPAKHDSNFLEGFFDFVGKQATGNGMAMMVSDQPVKRMKSSSGMGMGTSTGDPSKDILVAKIKAFQKQGDASKQTWHQFCDASLNGVYDPARHDAATLQMFITTHGLQDIPIPPSIGMSSANMGMGMGMSGMMGMGAIGGMGGVGGSIGGSSYAANPLAVRVKNFQRSGESNKSIWHTYCDQHLGGVRDPARHDQATLQKFVSTYNVP